MTLFLELFHAQNAENPICEDLNLKKKNVGHDALGSTTVYLKPLSLHPLSIPALGNCYIFIKMYKDLIPVSWADSVKINIVHKFYVKTCISWQLWLTIKSCEKLCSHKSTSTYVRFTVRSEEKWFILWFGSLHFQLGALSLWLIIVHFEWHFVKLTGLFLNTITARQ